MTDSEFKAGDLVYYAECKKICKVAGVFCENIVLDIGEARVSIPRKSFFWNTSTNFPRQPRKL